MALATQCPHCHTTFRVAHDQLKLRAGIVRCGKCRQVFNGIEHLLSPAEPQQAVQTENATATPETGTKDAAALILPAAPVPATNDAATTTPPSSAGLEPDFFFDFDFDSKPAAPVAKPDTAVPAQKTGSGDVLDELDYDALDGMTLMHFPQEEEEPEPPAAQNDHPATTAAVNVAAADAAALALATAEPAPASGTDIEDARLPGILRQSAAPASEQETEEVAQEEPGFVTTARRQQHRQRGVRRLFGAGSAILALVLLAQAGYALRNQIAAHLPQTKPSLLAICRTLGCSIALPVQIDAISIESSELQAQPGAAGALALTLLLRNRSSTVQSWPNIELTLNDGNQRAILRRVFTPREFPLSTTDIAKGFGADSEQTIRLSFTLTQLTAAGYRVVLYYP
ncbi:MAG: DUF3426 domain-containing protein [Burkholderiaceae bacterium]